jgi:Tfp pilus assembly protein PilO
MKLTKLFRTYQGLIVSVGVLIVSGLGIVLGVVPILEKTIAMNTQLKSVSAEVDVMRDKASLLESIDEGSMRDSVQTLLSAVPADKSVPTLLWTLDGLSAKTGVAVGNFSLAKLGSLATESAKRVSADEQAVGGNILPFTINISGTLDQLRGFLATSLSVRRLVRIRTLGVLFQKTASGSADMVTATLGMDTFYSPLPTTIGSVSQPLTALTSTDDDMIAKVAQMQLMGSPSLTVPPRTGGGAVKPDPFSL